MKALHRCLGLFNCFRDHVAKYAGATNLLQDRLTQLIKLNIRSFTFTVLHCLLFTNIGPNYTIFRVQNLVNEFGLIP